MRVSSRSTRTNHSASDSREGSNVCWAASKRAIDWHQRVEARGGGMLASDEGSQLSIDGPGKPGRAGSGCEEQHDETVAKAAPVHQESRTPGHRIAGMDAPAASRLEEREEIRERRRDERKRVGDDQQSAEGDERARDRVEAPPTR